MMVVKTLILSDKRKIMLLPSRGVPPTTGKGETSNLLSQRLFVKEVEQTDIAYMLIGKESSIEDGVIPDSVRPTLEKIVNVFPTDLSDGLPLLKDVKHQINQVSSELYQIEFIIG